MATATENVMESLLQGGPQIVRFRPGQIVEGTVVFRGKNKLLADLGGIATGIISGRELRDSFNTFKELTIGSTVMAMVLEEENDEGMYILSLRMASQQKAWDKFHQLVEKEGTMEFQAQEANKGGLLANIDGIRTFLPVSQLAPAHYPRVNNADSAEIINRLGKYIGHAFTVKIITMDEEAGKIVVSEREALAEERAKALESLDDGTVKDGIVTGIVKFGIFVAFDGLEGLVHISEIAWGHVKNPAEHAEVGDKVQVKVIGVDGDKLSLSMKQLTKDPWEEIAERYPVGKRVSGSVVRFADYGAFLKLEKDINGLVHLTEIAHYKVTDPSEALTIGQKVDAQVINIDIDERRIGLSVKALQPIDKETLEKIKMQEEAEAKEESSNESESEGPHSEEAKDTDEDEDVRARRAVPDQDESSDAETSSEKKSSASKPGPNTTEDEPKETKPETTSSDGAFVASKTGKKYYAAGSAAGKKIKEENKVFFASEKEAEDAGYSA